MAKYTEAERREIARKAGRKGGQKVRTLFTAAERSEHAGYGGRAGSKKTSVRMKRIWELARAAERAGLLKNKEGLSEA